VYQGALKGAPEHLIAIADGLGVERNDEATFYFNERVVEDGMRVVAAGRCEAAASKVHVVATDNCPVALGFGTLRAERARVRRVSYGRALLTGTLAGLAACALAETFVDLITAK
jgi:hypothetical protein